VVTRSARDEEQRIEDNITEEAAEVCKQRNAELNEIGDQNPETFPENRPENEDGEPMGATQWKDYTRGLLAGAANDGARHAARDHWSG
jgi:hypothetical protein